MLQVVNKFYLVGISFT